MASNKEHHFVPKFSLRRFASDPAGKYIGLYNIKNGIRLYKAPIRKQARVKNYYGTSGEVEKALSVIEGFAANLINTIITSKTIPSIKSQDYLHLLHFVLFQERRTQGAEATTNDNLTQLHQASYAKFGQVAPENKIPISEILLTALDGINVCNHLQFQLLLNETSIPFISSDHPVVMYNQLMETLNLHTASGWASKGLQVFYPISPTMVLMWSDPYVYRSGGKYIREVIRTSNESDICQLNALQYLNCHEQIFFNADFKPKYLDDLINRYNSIKRNAKPQVTTFGSFSLVHGIGHKIGLNLSFNKLNKYGKEFRPHGRLVYLRHPDLERERARRD